MKVCGRDCSDDEKKRDLTSRSSGLDYHVFSQSSSPVQFLSSPFFVLVVVLLRICENPIKEKPDFVS